MPTRDGQEKPSSSDGVGAAIGITVFQPEMSLLTPLLAAAQSVNGATYLFIDGPIGTAIDPLIFDQLKQQNNLTILCGEENRGVAAGINRLSSAAIKDGLRYILILDQDSVLDSNLVAQLHEDMRALRKKRENPAAIGPRPSAAPDSGTKPPRYRHRRTNAHGDLRTVDFIINSGMLIDLDAYRKIGPLYEPYGMDGVDLEWCYRAWSAGYSVWVDESLNLPHRIGKGIVRFGPLSFPKQSDSRMLSYVRNQTHLLTLPHVPWAWKARTLIYVPLQALAFTFRSGRRGKMAIAFIRAMRNGLTGNLTDLDRSISGPDHP